MKKIEKLLFGILFYKNVDPIFFISTFGTLKSLSQGNINKMNKKFYFIYKLQLKSSVTILLLIYLNILSTYILNKDYENNLTKLNLEVSIYDINRRKFSPTKPELLKKELEFRLHKELYYSYQQKQRILNLETIASLEQLYNIKYL